MTYSVRVGEYRKDGPEWWFNFLRSVIALISGKTWNALLNEGLKPYNACYLDNSTLMFDSEKDAILFILKWS